MKRKDNSKPIRKSIRLPEWDYRSEAAYFITICTYQRQHLFEDTRLHEIAASAWAYIPKQPHAHHVTLDEWIMMPNHIHGIIQISNQSESNWIETSIKGAASGSIGAIIGNYKMLVTKRVKSILRRPETGMKVWQRGYWERIIRNDRELDAIREYIQGNPARWSADRENLDKLFSKMQHLP